MKTAELWLALFILGFALAEISVVLCVTVIPGLWRRAFRRRGQVQI